MNYAQADYLQIPLLDDEFGVAQIFETPASRPNCVFLGLSARKVTSDDPISPFTLSEVVAFTFSTDTAITSGQWVIAGFDQIPRFRSVFNFDRALKNDFPDHPTHDPAVIEAFMSAWHGLYPWDSFGPLFDQIKRPDIDRPAMTMFGTTS